MANQQENQQSQKPQATSGASSTDKDLKKKAGGNEWDTDNKSGSGSRPGGSYNSDTKSR